MRIEVLQVGRAAAALAVLMSHIAIATNAFGAPLPPTLSAICSDGFLGVDYFFVLSGFIIFTTHSRDERNFRSAAEYVRKRLIRVYVPYLPISLAMISLYLMLPGVSGKSQLELAYLLDFVALGPAAGTLSCMDTRL